MAIGVMKAIYEYGLSTPKDFSLIGFSDALIAESIYPELTTANQFSLFRLLLVKGRLVFGQLPQYHRSP
jgi:hypothetical protein